MISFAQTLAVLAAAAEAVTASAATRYSDTWGYEDKIALEDVCQQDNKVELYMPGLRWKGNSGMPCYQMRSELWPIYCPADETVYIRSHATKKTVQESLEEYLNTFPARRGRYSYQFSNLETLPGNVTACREKNAAAYLAINSDSFNVARSDNKVKKWASSVRKGAESLKLEGVRVVFHKDGRVEDNLVHSIRLFKKLLGPLKFEAHVECLTGEMSRFFEALDDPKFFDDVEMTGSPEYCEEE